MSQKGRLATISLWGKRVGGPPVPRHMSQKGRCSTCTGPTAPWGGSKEQTAYLPQSRMYMACAVGQITCLRDSGMYYNYLARHLHRLLDTSSKALNNSSSSSTQLCDAFSHDPVGPYAPGRSTRTSDHCQTTTIAPPPCLHPHGAAITVLKLRRVNGKLYWIFDGLYKLPIE